MIPDTVPTPSLPPFTPVPVAAAPPPALVLECRRRLLRMVAEDEELRTPELLAEMGPLLEAVAPERRVVVLHAVLDWLAARGLIEHHRRGFWRATPRGRALAGG